MKMIVEEQVLHLLAQGRISILYLTSSTQTKTDLISFKQRRSKFPQGYVYFCNYSGTYRLNLTTAQI